MCGSSARTDLRGGRPAMAVPTATLRAQYHLLCAVKPSPGLKPANERPVCRWPKGQRFHGSPLQSAEPSQRRWPFGGGAAPTEAIHCTSPEKNKLHWADPPNVTYFASGGGFCDVHRHDKRHGSVPDAPARGRSAPAVLPVLLAAAFPHARRTGSLAQCHLLFAGRTVAEAEGAVMTLLRSSFPPIAAAPRLRCAPPGATLCRRFAAAAGRRTVPQSKTGRSKPPRPEK